ncbi:MAG: DNA gyrase subunit A [bacterium]
MSNNNDKQETKNTKSIVPLSIEKELKTSFLDYAMSVIVSRALPDVRDGLKPVHRRILYAMHKLGYYHEKSYRKSATVVGEVMGNYHPHGDAAIYQSIVGLVQDFSKRYPLLDGQGNWGSIDGDNAAAMRYSEVRMAKIARDLLTDIDKDTVHFVPNFDESKTEPTVLPSKVPNLLINGSTGIAVGMATSVPPHNLGEVVDASITLLKNPELTEDELFKIIPAPDFPTGGIICGRSGVLKAYRTGHGQVIVRGVIDVEENKKGSALVIKEIPYQVNKADLVTRIADLVKDKIIDSISNIRDESDRRGIRVVIELKKGENPQVLLNQLYKHTTLQSSISIIMLALLNNRPMMFTLREMIEQFLIHRKEIVTKRTEFELARDKARAHILEGLIIALDNIDAVVELIKKSKSAQDAIFVLNKKFALTEAQGKAILEMRLQRLTGLEQDKIHEETKELEKTIKQLELILAEPEELKRIIIEELEEIRKNYADARKTKIENVFEGDLTEADLIPNDEVVVTLTKKGYVKRVPIETYSVQRRGGKGKKGMTALEEADDIIQDLFVPRNHDDLFFFTNKGRIFSLKVYQIPEASRLAKGRAIVNLLQLPEGETVVKLLFMSPDEIEGKFVVMVTKKGSIKKTDAMAFAKVRSTGIRALNLHDDDELVFCDVSSGSDSIVVATAKGYGIRFEEKEVRCMGRQAAGVRAIKLRKADYVVGLEIIDDERDLLFATSRGYGKRVRIQDFRVAHRGGMGVRTIPTDFRNGDVIGLTKVTDESHLLLIDTNGKIIRLSSQEIRTMGRQAKGVRLVRLDSNQELSSVVAFEGNGEEDVSEEVNEIQE